jgi:hypothetical protein
LVATTAGSKLADDDGNGWRWLTMLADEVEDDEED